MDVVSVGSRVLDWLFSASRDRRRADDRLGERHHAEIKAEVLTPLRQRVEFLLAILEQRTSPVAVEGERLPDEQPRLRAVGLVPVRYQHVLRASVPEAKPVECLLKNPRWSPVDLGYYDCVKTTHLPDLVQELEALVLRVVDYCGRSLRLAEDLQEALTARAPVPVTLLDAPPDPPWLNPALLARHLLNRRLGVEPSELLPNESEGTLRTVEGTYMCRAPGRLDACVALVEQLLPDDRRAAALLTEGRALAPEAVKVERKVKDARRMGHLVGRCRYMRTQEWRSWLPGRWRRGRETRDGKG